MQKVRNQIHPRKINAAKRGGHCLLRFFLFCAIRLPNFGVPARADKPFQLILMHLPVSASWNIIQYPLPRGSNTDSGRKEHSPFSAAGASPNVSAGTP